MKCKNLKQIIEQRGNAFGLQFTNFLKIKFPGQNYGQKKDDMELVLYCGHTNIRRHCTQFSHM